MSDQQPPEQPQDGAQPPAMPPVPPVPPIQPPPVPPVAPQAPYGAPYGQQQYPQQYPQYQQPPPAGVPPQAGYGYNPGLPIGPAPQTNNNAIVAFVLALVSWFVCPIIAAIVALVFASKAGKEIRDSNGWQTGSGFVTAAKIISWINIGFFIVFGIFYLIVILVIVANPDIAPSYTPMPTFTEF